MVKRSTTIRDRHRDILRRRQGPCHLCGQPIDYDLPHLHPGEFVVDHVTPLNRGGKDTLANKQPAHRHCNRQKSDKLAEEPTPRYIEPFETSRAWSV